MARRVIKLAALATLAKQARDYAQEHPESVSSAIGKVEDTVARRLGPKYASHVGKGGKALRAGLGISSSAPTPQATPSAPEDPAQDAWVTPPESDRTPPTTG